MTDDDWRTRYEAIRAKFPDERIPLQLNPPTAEIKVPHVWVRHEFWSLCPDFIEKIQDNRVTRFFPGGTICSFPIEEITHPEKRRAED
jgi:hypothetical protein